MSSSQLRRYPVAEDTLDAILIAIDRQITIQAEISSDVSRTLGKQVGVRTVWQGIKYLVEQGFLHKRRGARNQINGEVDFRMLSYAITSEGYGRIYNSEV